MGLNYRKLLMTVSVFVVLGLLIGYLDSYKLKVLAKTDTFVVEVMNPDSSWHQIATPSFQAKYTTYTKEISFNNSKFDIRISNQSNSFGDIEFVLLNACGQNQPIKSAFLVQTYENVLDDISKDDLNVLVIDNKGVQVNWNIPEGCTQGELVIKANKYTTDPSRYMSFPDGNANYVTYNYRNNSSIVIDGLLSEDVGVAPQWAPVWTSSTGHPVGTTFIYANDDSEYVYISADITPDNTNEYGTDWFQISVRNSKDKNLYKNYRVTDEDATYGRCSFGITSMVPYKHQTCEIRIPKSEIKGTNMQFSLQYYGTMSSSPPVFVLNEPETPNPIDETSVFTVSGSVHTVNGAGTNENISGVTLNVYDISQNWLELNGICTADDGAFNQNEEYFTCTLPTLSPQSSLSSSSGYLYLLDATSLLSNSSVYTSLPVFHYFTLSNTPETLSILPSELLSFVGNVSETESTLFGEMLPSYIVQSVKMSIFNNDTDLFMSDKQDCLSIDGSFDSITEDYNCQFGDLLPEGNYTVYVNAFSPDTFANPVSLLNRSIQLHVGIPATPTPTLTPTQIPTVTPFPKPTKIPNNTYQNTEVKISVTPSVTTTITPTQTVLPTITPFRNLTVTPIKESNSSNLSIAWYWWLILSITLITGGFLFSRKRINSK